MRKGGTVTVVKAGDGADQGEDRIGRDAKLICQGSEGGQPGAGAHSRSVFPAAENRRFSSGGFRLNWR